ncbi:hypothetical protein LTR94_028209 [Friedmanniomyces endolithicus]|nr:hypothetical protein LTR94_028209 [Friedmanniomyces endolithicus]
MLIGYMRVSSVDDRQSVDLQRDALNEELFDSLADARRKLAIWRYDYNHVRPHSSLGNRTPAQARRTRAYRNIQPQDSRYDRGTAGGQVTCLEFLKAGDTLVVWKLDRLGRSLTNLLAIITDLKNRGVAFRSLTEQMDTSTPHGELLFSLFGALAQYERALTRERVMAGLVAARRRGRFWGGLSDRRGARRLTA